MGKRIEDLRKLDESPIERQVEALEARERPETDLRDQPWYQLVARIDELLESDAYAWAVETLNGIRETVERTRRVSEAQHRAIDNIENGGARRRYEGWQRRWR